MLLCLHKALLLSPAGSGRHQPRWGPWPHRGLPHPCSPLYKCFALAWMKQAHRHSPATAPGSSPSRVPGQPYSTGRCPSPCPSDSRVASASHSQALHSCPGARILCASTQGSNQSTTAPKHVNKWHRVHPPGIWTPQNLQHTRTVNAGNTGIMEEPLRSTRWRQKPFFKRGSVTHQLRAPTGACPRSHHLPSRSVTPNAPTAPGLWKKQEILQDTQQKNKQKKHYRKILLSLTPPSQTSDFPESAQTL